jgi:hypothetical protein
VPHRLQLARRPGQHDDGRRVVLARRHDEPRRGADRLQDPGAGGDHRLLAVGHEDGGGVEVGPARHQRTQDRGDAPLERLVEDHLAILELADDRGRQVVGGRPEPAARDDQRAALGRQEAQRAQDVGRAVSDQDDRDRVGAEREQLLRQPRAVAIQHAPRQHLGAGDDDPRPDAHGVGVTRRAGACPPTAAGARAAA